VVVRFKTPLRVNGKQCFSFERFSLVYWRIKIYA